MRILLDECVPRRLRGELPGHDVQTVPELGWSGKKNGELLALMAANVQHTGAGGYPRLGHAGAPVLQNAVDENTHKALNFAVFARPERIRGLQVGFSAYRDLLTPAAVPAIDETIFAAHAVYTGLDFEWLNEALLIRHSPQGTPQVFNTPGFYSQISRRYRSYRPYFRYQYLNAPASEPIFSPSVGLL